MRSRDFLEATEVRELRPGCLHHTVQVSRREFRIISVALVHIGVTLWDGRHPYYDVLVHQTAECAAHTACRLPGGVEQKRGWRYSIRKLSRWQVGKDGKKHEENDMEEQQV